MKTYYNAKAVLLLLCMILLCSSCAMAESDFSFPATFVLTEQDITQLTEVAQHAFENQPKNIGVTSLTYMQRVTEMQMWMAQNPGKTPDTIYALPGPEEMSHDTAVLYAYKAVKAKTDYDKDILELFYPYLYLDATDADNPVWVAEMMPNGEGVFETYGMFHIRIQAKTGVIESCYGVEDAAG